ncbi:MAG: pilin [bacterium]|nr:pilin [bacterium]
MKKAFIVFSILASMALVAFAHAQRQYDYDFVGPRENSSAQYGSYIQAEGTVTCGPQANGDYILCESTGGIISQTQRNFADFLQEIYNLAFILAGTVAFVRIVYGGVLYSWSGVVERKKEAMSIFKNVAIGMGLLMGSYAVLNTINPALTMLKLPTSVEIKPQSSQAKIGDPMSPEIRGVMERASREMTADIDLLQHQIDELNAKENKNVADRARLIELNGQLDKTQSTQKGVQYQLSTEERLNQLNKGMTTDQMFKAR